MKFNFLLAMIIVLALGVKFSKSIVLTSMFPTG